MTEQEQNEFVEKLFREMDEEEAAKMATVQVGFLVRYIGDDRRFTFSGLRYLTRGRVYRVLDAKSKGKQHSIVIEGDIEGERGHVGPSEVEVIGEGPAPEQLREVPARPKVSHRALQVLVRLFPGVELGAKTHGIPKPIIRHLDDQGLLHLRSTDKDVYFRLTEGGRQFLRDRAARQ